MWEKFAKFMTRKWKWVTVPSLVIGLVTNLALASLAGAYIYDKMTSLQDEPVEVESGQIERETNKEEENLPEYEPLPQETPEQPSPPTYSQAELEQIIGEVWDYVWGTPPTPENFEWAKNKMLSESWSRYDLQDYLMKTPEFQQAYYGIPENMTPQEYREGFSTLNAVWLSSRGRELTKEEYARVLRGESIPYEYPPTIRQEP